MATLYVDYKNGDDTDTGGTSDPLKTLGHCLSSHASAGDTIYLRGSTSDNTTWFREYGHSVSLNNLTIANDTGHAPVLVATNEYTSWSKTAGRTNVYEAAYTAAQAWAVWNGSTKLTSAGSVAACDGAANSFYFDNAGDKLYVNIGGDAPTSIEAYDGGNWYIGTVTGTGVTLRGLEWRYQMQALRLQANTVLQDCVFRYNVGYSAATTDFGWLMVSAASANIDGCTIYGQTSAIGIAIVSGASSVTIQDCTITGGYYAIKVEAGTGHSIHDCTISGVGGDWGILAQGSSAGTVYNATVYDCNYGGIKLGNTGGSSIWTAHHCTTYDTTGLMNYGFNSDGGDSNWYHCVAYDIADDGFILQTDGTVNAKNNIAVSCGSRGYYAVATYTPTLAADYNCAYGNATNYFGDWSEGAHDVTTDPSFVNAGAANFHLASGSPCIDAGVAITGINDGYTGTAPDIGRFELISSTGTLSATLAAATLGATGTAKVTGTASATLAAATINATGAVTIDGTAAINLEAATLAGVGGVQVAGAIAATLADATLSGTGTVGNAPATGALSVTLEAATCAATGTVGVIGSLSVTLADATCAATGIVAIDGDLSVTLADATLAATGTVAVAGALSITLADATLSATGNVSAPGTAIGTLAVTLADATLSAAGTVAIAGSTSTTLEDATVTGTGVVGIEGDATILLADATLSATGVVGAAVAIGTLSITLEDATCAGTGTVAISASGIITLADATLGGVGAVSVYGALSVTLASATLAGVGTVTDIAAGTGTRTVHYLGTRDNLDLGERATIYLPAREDIVIDG